MRPAVTVLAPAYDELPVIERFVRSVMRVVPDTWELLVVDDGSTDGTAGIVDRLAAQLDRVRVVHHANNRGLGAALATGFAEARGDVIVTVDADLSHPLELLEVLVEQTSHADAAFASRYVGGGAMEGIPARRRVISIVANRILRALFRSPVRDMTTGMRAYRRSAVVDLPVVSRGFEVQLELAVRLLRAGRRIVEVPLVLRDREAGESKMRYRRLVPTYIRLVVALLARLRAA